MVVPASDLPAAARGFESAAIDSMPEVSDVAMPIDENGGVLSPEAAIAEPASPDMVQPEGVEPDPFLSQFDEGFQSELDQWFETKYQERFEQDFQTHRSQLQSKLDKRNSLLTNQLAESHARNASLNQRLQWYEQNMAALAKDAGLDDGKMAQIQLNERDAIDKSQQAGQQSYAEMQQWLGRQRPGFETTISKILTLDDGSLAVARDQQGRFEDPRIEDAWDLYDQWAIYAASVQTPEAFSQLEEAKRHTWAVAQQVKEEKVQQRQGQVPSSPALNPPDRPTPQANRQLAAERGPQMVIQNGASAGTPSDEDLWSQAHQANPNDADRAYLEWVNLRRQHGYTG